MALFSILGQNKAVTLITRAIESGRLAHAYLFAGPDGVGKTTLALEAAALLLCRNPVAGGACQVCPSCQKLRTGNHPDLLRLKPDGATIKIDQIRSLKRALTYPPFESRLRVVVLEETQAMRREAANSLLKLLEEPPPDNLLILIGNTAGSLLDTIISRCQLIPFTALSGETTTAIIQTKKPELSPADAQALAALADGCPGQALALDAESVLAFYRRLLAALLTGSNNQASSIETALQLAMELAQYREGLDTLFNLLRLFFKNAMHAVMTSPGSTLTPELLQARERWNLTQLSAKMAAIDLMEQALARNCNRTLAGEVLLLDLFDCETPLSSRP